MAFSPFFDLVKITNTKTYDKQRKNCKLNIAMVDFNHRNVQFEPSQCFPCSHMNKLIR